MAAIALFIVSSLAAFVDLIALILETTRAGMSTIGILYLREGDHGIYCSRNPHRQHDPQEQLPLYLGFFEFVHNVKKQGTTLLHALIELLIT